MTPLPGPTRNRRLLASLKALRRAARKVRADGRRLGLPVWVLIDGRIVDLTRLAGRRRARQAGR